MCKSEQHAHSSPILGDICFKLTNTSSNNQDSTVSLRWPCNRVFDKVSVSWGINDGHLILVGFKFPQGDINGGTTLIFSFQFIQGPGTPEGALPHLSSLLLKFVDGSFVGPTTFVDQMASSGRLAGIYTSNNHSVESFPFPFWLGFSGGFLETCVLAANPLWKSPQWILMEKTLNHRGSDQCIIVYSGSWVTHLEQMDFRVL